MRFLWIAARSYLLVGSAFLAFGAYANPVDFHLPAQVADAALLSFSIQAKVEVLFAFDELHRAVSTEVNGPLEPEEALVKLLRGTGFVARTNRKGKFIVLAAGQPTGVLKGRLLTPDSLPARGVRVIIPEAHQGTMTDDNGDFAFPFLPPGIFRLIATSPGYQPLQILEVTVEANHEQTLIPRILQLGNEPMRLSPVVVEGKTGKSRLFGHAGESFPPRSASGNIDLNRTADDALPYTIFDRDQIVRSGVVTLNEFLQRQLLDSVPRPSDQSLSPVNGGGLDSVFAGSANLNLRGYDTDETVVLVNGRRLPDVLTNGSNVEFKARNRDVDFIPLSLVQEIQVLPASASALYAGSPVGGVINIVLRPDVDANATEVTVTYTNALRGFDAPQSSVSLMHGQTSLGGALRMRVNATFTRSLPATEAELGYRQRNLFLSSPSDGIYSRATPNIRSGDGEPLFGPGTATVTSVAPGAEGTGGLAAFDRRQGVRSIGLFKGPGGLTVSPDSLDFPFGQRQHRAVYYGSFTYDAFSWLQVGLDCTYSSTIINRGYDVIRGDLKLAASSPLNPFSHDVSISLNETAPLLGENYSEGRVSFSSAVLGLLVKLPADWRISVDTQCTRSLSKYRGLAGADPDRWQALVDTGGYNPLRDTQVFGPPQEFYDKVLIYRGGKGQFVTVGDYTSIDAALRTTNERISLPTGVGTLNFGGDYRRNTLGRFSDEQRFADGSLAAAPTEWSGRTLQQYSAFGEARAPIFPQRWLPSWLHAAEADVAVRYVASNNAGESSVAPTYALKLGFAGGFALRGSFTTSNRVPTPHLGKAQLVGSSTPGSGVNLTMISDPRRGGDKYGVQATDVVNPNLRTEDAVTQTAGLIFERGKVHRVRASIDFVDTRKTNEIADLREQPVLDLEGAFPERVRRGPLQPDDIAFTVGKVTALLTGTANLAWRHSQNWNTTLDYAWTECFGGALELYGRLVYFERYDLAVLPTSPVVDELGAPNFSTGLLKYRANFGIGWSKTAYALGIDGHYFHSRVLVTDEWALQGSRQIDPFWQYDLYLQSDLGCWLPWKSSRFGLRGQLRINNVLGPSFHATRVNQRARAFNRTAIGEDEYIPFR